MKKIILLCTLLCTSYSAIAFEITSSAFAHKGIMDAKYTCVGENISPPLTWKDPPEGTKSFVLIMDDPDAGIGTWDHMLIYNMPAEVRELPENFTVLPGYAQFGMNSNGKAAYAGPCPPQGIHRYIFKLYALDVTLEINGPVRSVEIQKAMLTHILGKAELIGRYQKP